MHDITCPGPAFTGIGLKKCQEEKEQMQNKIPDSLAQIKPET